ncbi:MAG: transposase [Nitrosomonadales bacterium]|nr:transposase [Nitrosomonadales bacterium]
MSDQPSERHRRSLRLKGYDYSQAGAYFVTVCVCNRECLFGEIEGGMMRLNKYGEIVASEWLRSADVRSEIECGEFVVMPNHLHGIVHIVGAYGNTPSSRDEHKMAYSHNKGVLPYAPTSPSRNIGAMVRGFKSAVSRRINEIRGTPGEPVWQRNYYEHVIRNDDDYNCIAEYIANNPQRWMEDSLHP